jgi:hypothetical protein
MGVQKNVQAIIYVWHVEQGWHKTTSFMTKCKMPKWDKSFQALEIYKQLSQFTWNSKKLLFSRSINSTFDFNMT